MRRDIMGKKFLIVILLALLALALPTLSNAATVDSGSCGSGVTYTLSDTGLLTISGSSAILRAPWDNDAVNEVKIISGVTSIGADVFYNCPNLIKVTIPSTVLRINDSAFENCGRLTTLTLANGVKVICPRAFYGTGLTQFKIMDSITTIGNYAFSYCGSLKEVTSGTTTSSLTTLGEGAFQNCSKLEKVILGNQLKKIGSYTFSECANLTNVTLPSGLTEIGYQAFSTCSKLASITLPSTVTTIGESAFDSCASLASITLPSSLKNLGSWAFSGTALRSITIPNQVTTLKTGVFSFCTNLTSITFGSGVTTIGEQAFDSCTALKSVTIPSGVTSIEDRAFQNCTALTNITIRSKTATLGDGVFDNHNTNLTIHAFIGSPALQYAKDHNINYVEIYPAPTFYQQPQDVTVNEGQTATFQVKASYAASFQWYYRTSSHGAWSAVQLNGTSSTYKVTTQARHNGYQYKCLATNAEGAKYSDYATLTVNPKPVITKEPVDATVNVGGTAVFIVTAQNATAYQWYYTKPGDASRYKVSNNGTSASYSLITAARHNGYIYTCKVSNSAGHVWSANVTLTVVSKPVITTQPTNVTVNVGGKATFKVVASNATTYQWYYQKPNDSTWYAVSNNGASATYTLTTKERHNGYKYHCKVSNIAGDVYSNTVTLTVTSSSKPTITTQPTNQNVNEGAKATFKVVASNATAYKWSYQKPGTSTWIDVSENGTSATYTLTAMPRHNGYKYRCKVSNASGDVFTNIVTLTVNCKPVITSQPANLTVTAGNSAVFKVTATGAVSYKWYYQKPGESTWTPVSSVNGTYASYSFTAAARHNGYKYRCTVTNAAGSVVSSIATLTVK